MDNIGLTTSQNRELQIMRIVRHPNIVQLKAFYYSNGERVCFDRFSDTPGCTL